ncbi:uncharacterized protein LOC110907502 [Helianthus annuus]|uniref:uncharacterized protein LOC110907502 n=1 Tax=Helianthus annuus TaxID=4232 RepID=UPI000B8EF955|nr:uncharacterized protein LOC110907502 [Helianthus annuus]
MQKPPKLMNLDEYAGWSGGEEDDQYSPTAIKEDILVLLQHGDDSQSMWQALKLKFQGSVSMIKSKKALIKKEFDIFTGMKGETSKQLIERYCHHVVEMRRLEIKKTDEEWIDKLSDALPYDEWGTYLMMLKNNSDFVNLNLSAFIEKIEAHELELLKIRKMNSANVQQDVSLYYKGSTPVATNQSPKIQTDFSADTNSSASTNTPQSSKSSSFVNYDPNFKAQEQASPQSSTSSNNQAYVSRVQCNIAVNIKNGNEITETAAKQHIALLASVLEAYEGLVAGRIEIVEVPEMVTEPEVVVEEVPVVVEDVPVENMIDIEEITAEVYYYQSEQEVFASYFEEPTTGSCPRYEEKKEVVEEMIDVTQEMTGEKLKDIADKALMGKLKEVDTEPEKSESVSTVSVKQESDLKSGVQEVKVSESDLKNVASDTDNESQVIKTVVDQVLDEESDNSEKSQSEKSVSESEDEGIEFEKKTAKQVFKPKEKMNDIFVAGPSVDDEKNYIFSQKAVDDFNTAKKFKEETLASTFVEYDKRVCYRCNEIGHMAKQCTKVFEKPVFVLKDDVVEFENELDKFLAEFPPINNKVKPVVKDDVPNVTFNFPKTAEKCDVVFGTVSEGLPKSILSKWIMDSGASRHMTGTLALLYDVKSINGSYVGFAENQGGRIVGQGTLTNGVISFDKVNYIVELENNLLSISQICDKSFSVHFTKNECVVLKPGFKIPDEMVLLRAPQAQ